MHVKLDIYKKNPYIFKFEKLQISKEKTFNISSPTLTDLREFFKNVCIVIKLQNFKEKSPPKLLRLNVVHFNPPTGSFTFIKPEI